MWPVARELRCVELASAEAIAGEGLVGDRYREGTGFFPGYRPIPEPGS